MRSASGVIPNLMRALPSLILAALMQSVALAQTERCQLFDVTFNKIPIDAPEIVNPLRGLYTDYDGNVAPLPKPPLLSYKRFLWSDIESSPGVFDFSKIDSELAKAQAVNGKFAVRIMPVSTPGSPKTANGTSGGVPANIDVPPDFPALLKKGYFINEQSASPISGQPPTLWKLYVPDYNDKIYIDRAKTLITALASRYDNDPRIAYIEASFIGTFGEGNYTQMPKPTPSGATPPSFAMTTTIIDAFCSAFRYKRIVVPTDIFSIKPPSEDNSPYGNALAYALSRHPDVGMFRNSLGDTVKPLWFVAPFQNPDVIKAGGTTRWEHAPFFAEWFGPGQPSVTPPQSLPGQIILGLSEIPDNHLAAIANGALGKNFPAGSIPGLQQCGKLAGYRFQLDRVNNNQSANCNRSLSLNSYWENVGATPTYEPWRVVYLLKNSHNQVVWQATSRIQLHKLLPTNGSPQTVTDRFQIPPTLPAGNYQLALAVEDPLLYYKSPMALAVTGAQPDGSYNISQITIGE